MLTKGAVVGEGVPGGFAMLYKVLTAFEDAGRCQRGYFVESLGGAQFAVASTVDRLRTYLDGVDRSAASTRPWCWRPPIPPTRTAPPCRGPRAPTGRGARRAPWWRSSTVSWPGSSSAAGARCSPSPTMRKPTMPPPVPLADLVGTGRVQSLLVEKVNGVPVLDAGRRGRPAAVVAALTGAGFARTPRGLRLR